MRRASILRSTPVRQALILVALFAAVNLVTLGAAWLKLSADLTETIRGRVGEEIAGLDISATPAALATLVAAKARAADPAATIYAFRGSDGRRAGNALVLVEGGELQLLPTEDGPLSDAGYLHEIRRLSGGVLVVAESLAPLRELRQTFLSLLAFSLGPTLVVSLGLAVLIARNSARRVEEIEATLGRLAAGDLAARYDGPPDRGDDLSRIGAGVNRMARKHEASTEAIRQVSADIAHDLRTPLQRISVLLDDLRRHLPQDGAAAGLAEQAGDEAARAVSVFQALLQIAQIEGGSPAAGFAPVDLGEVARRIGELYEPAAEDAGHHLALEIDEAAAVVEGDGSLIGQAIANLLENAIRHTPGGSRITLSVRAAGTGPELAVTDTGPGIPEAERGQVLKRLYRLERSRTTEGNGLGLSLVAAIAAAHGAALALEDAAPGLRVRLSFPPGGATATR